MPLDKHSLDAKSLRLLAGYSEIGLVAKLAGHANANVTLGHYTQAVRGGEQAVAALERAYTGQSA